jgi:hypothetical protein
MMTGLLASAVATDAAALPKTTAPEKEDGCQSFGRTHFAGATGIIACS